MTSFFFLTRVFVSLPYVGQIACRLYFFLDMITGIDGEGMLAGHVPALFELRVVMCRVDLFYLVFKYFSTDSLKKYSKSEHE